MTVETWVSAISNVCDESKCGLGSNGCKGVEYERKIVAVVSASTDGTMPRLTNREKNFSVLISKQY